MRSMYFIFFLSIFFHLSSTEELPLHPESVISPHKEPLIKVRISQDLPGVYVDIKGHYQAKESISGEPILGGFREKIYHIVHKKEGLAWPHPVPGLNHITLVPDSSLSSLLINGIQYKGIIHIGYTEQRKIEIIEEVDIEHFLQCTLPLVLPSYPLEKETVRALAIVARTEAYYTKNQKQKEPFAKEASLLGYKGNLLPFSSAPIREAIEDTRYAILNFQGKPFAAQWSEDSSGETVHPSLIFRTSLLSPTGVQIKNSENTEENSWEFFISQKELSKLIGLEKIEKVSLFLAKPSSKVYNLRFTSGSIHKDLSVIEVQKLLKEDNLRSNQFRVSTEKGGFVFYGTGAGLGMGLCVKSADAMAKQGKNAAQILAKFFPDTQIVNGRLMD